MTNHNTAIEWTHIPGYNGETWNPIVGCSVASPGCKNCYAMRQAARIVRMSKGKSHYADTVTTVNGNPVWTRKMARASKKTLTAPLRWKKPRAIFVNSMGDLFHEDVPDEWIDQVFAVATLAPQHIFIVLTKRAKRMRDYVIATMNSDDAGVGYALDDLDADDPLDFEWPLPNVWLGASVEDQNRADEHIPHLLNTPAALRLVSVEPMLGQVDFDRPYHDYTGYSHKGYLPAPKESDDYRYFAPKIDWVICGGESGPNARPMHPDWVRSLRDQCSAADVPFFFKQWGEWLPADDHENEDLRYGEFHNGTDWVESCMCAEGDDELHMRVGKARAGHLLDGIEHHEFPKCVEVENA